MSKLATTWTPPINWKADKIILEGRIFNTPVRIEIDDSVPNLSIEECCVTLQKSNNCGFDIEKKICNRKETCYFILRKNDKRSKEELKWVYDPNDLSTMLLCDVESNRIKKEDLINED